MEDSLEDIMAKKKGMKLIANNKKAFHDYFIEDTYEAVSYTHLTLPTKLEV